VSGMTQYRTAYILRSASQILRGCFAYSVDL
jgi:hypothetical protein